MLKNLLKQSFWNIEFNHSYRQNIFCSKIEVYIALVLIIRLLQRVIPIRECHKMGEMSQCSVALLFIRYTIQKLNNSKAKRKGNHSCEGVFIFDKDTQNFYLGFFGIYNIYIENSFANKVTRIRV